METAGKLAGFAVCAALVALILRRLRPEAGWGVSLGAGAIVLLAALPALSALVRGIASLSAMSGLDDSFMQQLLKIAGLSLLLDFAAQTCRDAQEEALAAALNVTGLTAADYDAVGYGYIMGSSEQNGTWQVFFVKGNEVISTVNLDARDATILLVEPDEEGNG